MSFRGPYSRKPFSRGAGGIIPALKQAATDLTVHFGETVTKRLITPVRKYVEESIVIGISSLVFPTKHSEAEFNYILLDSTLNKLREIEYRKVINPLIIEDWNTGEYTLEFSYPVGSPDDLLEGGQVILIKDEDGDLTPFEIKEVTLSSRGDQVAKVKCDHLLYELGNGLPQTYSAENQTVAQAATRALQDVRWEVGSIAESITDLKDLAGSYYNPLKMLRQVAYEYTCRIKFRATVGTTSITGLYVDVLEIDNQFTGQRFEFGHNIAGIDIQVDHSRIYTAITGLVPGAETDPVTNLPQPLTFAAAEWSIVGGDPVDKPLGQTWVGNEEARLLYGIYNPDTEEMDHRFGIYDSGAAESPETLLAATWLIGGRYHFSPQVNIEANIADLSKVKLVDIISGESVTLENDRIRVGNVCYVIAKHNGLLAAIDARIIRIERYPKEPQKTRVILGDAMIYASDYFAELADSLEARDARSRPTDRGPGAAVTIASEHTSIAPQYADIIVPAEATNFQDYFATAMALLPDAGGQILILEGEYIFDDTSVINKNNVTVTGQGQGTVLKLAPGTDGYVDGFYTTTKTGITIRDITLDGDRDNQGDVVGDGIRFEDSAYQRARWAWNFDGFTKGANPQDNKIGWGFSLDTDITVDKVRIKSGNAGNKSVTIYKVNGGTTTLLSTTAITSVADVWVEAELSTPLELENSDDSGNMYIIMTYEANAAQCYYVLETNMNTNQFRWPVEWVEETYRATGGDGTPPNATTDATFAVDLHIAGIENGLSNFTIRNVITKNWTNNGMYLAGGYNGEIVNCKSFNNATAGLWVGNILSLEAENIKITGNEFNDNDKLGAWIAYGSGYLVQNNSFTGNNDAGLLLYSIRNSSVVGNTCRQAGVSGTYTLAGLIIFLCDDNTITGNTSSENNYWGISVEYSNRNVISGNVCSDSAQASGIILTNSSTYNTVQSNKCYANAVYGIRVDAGANYNQVTNNDLAGNTTGGLSNAGTGTVTTAGNR